MRTANSRHRFGELTDKDVFLFSFGERIARLRVGALGSSVEESGVSSSGES
jgi:hypothetical protein